MKKKKMIKTMKKIKTNKKLGNECTEKLLNGASDGNRTRILTLARLRSTTELHLQITCLIMILH